MAVCICMAIAYVGAGGQQTSIPDGYFSSISKYEIELLISDVAKSNPKVLEYLANDPDAKKSQIESLKQLLAFASQAQRDGLVKEPTNRQELENIRNEVVAVNYDRELNKGRPAKGAFGYITEKQVAAFWAVKPARENEFEAFLKAKIDILNADDPDRKVKEITADEKEQARDVFAKIRIYSSEFDARQKAGSLPKEFIDKAGLQVRLQQAQFLARLVSEKMSSEINATDDDISKYIAEHPELDPKTKRAKAQTILDRAKAGEDFAALADENSEDPGNVGSNGKKSGGIYRDIPKGQMVEPFEKAALAVKAGEIYPEIVETDFGFHIIKLERKGTSNDPSNRGAEVYDARHILISTSVANPLAPNLQAKPLKDFVREKIELDLQVRYVDRLVAEHKIQVPDDFTVPGPSTVAEAKKPAKKKVVSSKRPVKKKRK
jgi:PPIC-type PPIASE domain